MDIINDFIGLALAALICYVVFADKLIYIFMDSSDMDNAAAAEAGALFLRIVSPFFPAVAFKLTLDGILRGAGMLKSFMISTFSDLILRVGFAFTCSAP